MESPNTSTFCRHLKKRPSHNELGIIAQLDRTTLYKMDILNLKNLISGKEKISFMTLCLLVGKPFVTCATSNRQKENTGD